VICWGEKSERKQGKDLSKKKKGLCSGQKRGKKEDKEKN